MRAQPKYSFEFTDLEGPDDKGLFLSAELITEGNTLEELLENAWYALIDQDGGEYGQREADDDYAAELITEKFNEVTKGVQS